MVDVSASKLVRSSSSLLSSFPIGKTRESLERQITLYVLCYPCDAQRQYKYVEQRALAAERGKKKETTLESRRLRQCSSGKFSAMAGCWVTRGCERQTKRMPKYTNKMPTRDTHRHRTEEKKKNTRRQKQVDERHTTTKALVCKAKCIRERDKRSLPRTNQLSWPRRNECMLSAPAFNYPAIYCFAF